MKCCHCDSSEKELRPYGPRGSWVCFDCAMATPERQAEAERNFISQLEACGPGPVVIGEVIGPYPADHNPEVAKLIQLLEDKE